VVDGFRRSVKDETLGSWPCSGEYFIERYIVTNSSGSAYHPYKGTSACNQTRAMRYYSILFMSIIHLTLYPMKSARKLSIWHNKMYYCFSSEHECKFRCYSTLNIKNENYCSKLTHKIFRYYIATCYMRKLCYFINSKVIVVRIFLLVNNKVWKRYLY
jgi:hypothetical protein